jgi:hypothetical protein
MFPSLKRIYTTNIYRSDETNIGDWYSAPNKYFDLGSHDADIWKMKTVYEPPHKNVIYGGGGLIGQMRPLSYMTQILKRQGYSHYGWGRGDHSYICLNEQLQYIPNTPIQYPACIRDFDLLGIRDDYKELRSVVKNVSWVPCASCMHKAFDVQYNIETEVVFFSHSTLPLNIVHGMPQETWNYPHLMNDESDFNKVIRHLASGEVIVTNSYHGAYWGTLLGRKVIAFPWCSKFWGFRHKPVLCKPQEWLQQIKTPTTYPEAKEESREANINFYYKIIERIGNDKKL